jgi:hypothetical protein
MFGRVLGQRAMLHHFPAMRQRVMPVMIMPPCWDGSAHQTVSAGNPLCAG